MASSVRALVGTILLAVGPLTAGLATARTPPPTRGFDVRQIGHGVYAVIRREPLGYAVHSNTTFIVGDSDVVVVDTDFTRAAALEVLAALRRITAKPVRRVINTHWHDDHVMGNQVYRDSFPGVEFIAHVNTREALTTDAVDNRKQQLAGGPGAVAQLRDAIAKKRGLAGGPMADDERDALESSIAIFERYMSEAPGTRLVLPTRTFEDSLIVTQGRRQIRILHFGRANTRGDALVHIPDERILITGDLVVWPVPFTFGAYLGDWLEALGRLRSLGARTIVPGHGPVMRDDSYVRLLERLLTSVREQAAAAVARGETLDQARASVRLDDLREEFAGGSAARNLFFSSFVTGPAVARAYEEASAVSPEERAVLAVVQRFFDAMRVRDTAGVRAVFEPGARLVGVRTRASGEQYVQSLSVSDFVGFIGRDARATWTERAWNPEVRIEGTLATVWAEYDFHFGSTFSHCGVDAVQLLRTGSEWKIVSIADTYQKEGCTRRDPPGS